MSIVKYQAHRLWRRLPSGVEIDDLITAGTFGLMKAADGFDPQRGIKFETYCVPRIYGAMLDELRDGDWVPRLVRSKASKLSKAVAELDRELGRTPTFDETAERLGLSERDLDSLVREADAVGMTSLDRKLHETDSFKDVREVDILENKKAERCDERQSSLDHLRTLLSGCNKNERLLLIGYYWEGETMKQIGEQLGLSKSRISQMHSVLLPRIRSRLEKIAS